MQFKEDNLLSLSDRDKQVRDVSCVMSYSCYCKKSSQIGPFNTLFNYEIQLQDVYLTWKEACVREGFPLQHYL